MSFEGRYDVLCGQGHLAVFDALETDSHDLRDERCPSCGSTWEWWTIVDETNPPEDGKYPGEVDLEIEESAVFERCNLGHAHKIKPERYRIPDGVGHRRGR